MVAPTARRSMILAAPIVLLTLAALALGCASSGPSSEARAQLSLGSTVAPAVLEDQFGDEHRIDRSLKVILLSRDMDGGRVIREVLEAHPGALQRLEAVYIADISGMPSVIASMMAIPKMRDRPYPTLLDREGDVTAGYPTQAGKATLMVLDGLRVERIDYIGSVEEMAAALGVRTGE